MTFLANFYRHSLALLTDLYQLTMAYGYWKQQMSDREAVFHLTFRRCPFQGQYAVACGLEAAVEFLLQFRYAETDLAYLATLIGNDDRPLFEPAFLDYLQRLELRCDIDAIPEGVPVFPHEPLVRVRGPLLQAQLLETPLLNLINFPTLIATKAARVCHAAGDDEVLEFGLRRAQGVDGGVTASRAAFVGGCSATSNVLAGKLFDIPVRGTHAHSWVMAFDDELSAFRAYAQAMPNNSVLLVDTYDSLDGVRHAVLVGRELHDAGHTLVGVRLDSGDLAELSRASREMLDNAGFRSARIVASGDLDEHLITKLKQRGARVDVWGVGTRLATGHEQSALGGIYKLSALRSPDGSHWLDKMKLSEQPAKSSAPGILQVRRFVRDGMLVGDVIYDEPGGLPPDAQAVWPTDGSIQPLPDHDALEDLLVPVFTQGKLVHAAVGTSASRDRARHELARLPISVRQLENPDVYPVRWEATLAARRATLSHLLQKHSP